MFLLLVVDHQSAKLESAARNTSNRMRIVLRDDVDTQHAHDTLSKDRVLNQANMGESD